MVEDREIERIRKELYKIYSSSASLKDSNLIKKTKQLESISSEYYKAQLKKKGTK
jgi:hypothetical protein